MYNTSGSLLHHLQSMYNTYNQSGSPNFTLMWLDDLGTCTIKCLCFCADLSHLQLAASYQLILDHCTHCLLYYLLHHVSHNFQHECPYHLLLAHSPLTQHHMSALSTPLFFLIIGVPSSSGSHHFTAQLIWLISSSLRWVPLALLLWLFCDMFQCVSQLHQLHPCVLIIIGCTQCVHVTIGLLILTTQICAVLPPQDWHLEACLIISQVY